MALTKTQTWAEAVALLTTEGFDKKSELYLGLQDLLAPKVGGNSTRPEDEDGMTWCRYTGQYWNYEDMVYQNPQAKTDKKHKGYSKEGISRWTKASKFNKDTKDKLLNEMLKTEPDLDEVAKLKELVSNFKGNDPVYLETFAKDEK